MSPCSPDEERASFSVMERYGVKFFGCKPRISTVIFAALGCLLLVQFTGLFVYRNLFFGGTQSTDLHRLGIAPWVRLLRAHNSGKITTVRRACREYTMGAQTCVYEGLLCVNTSGRGPKPSARILKDPKYWNPARNNVYFIDDSKPNGARVPHDNWCGLRQQSAEPWYYGAKHWPILKNTVAPQQSCVQAYYRTAESVFGSGSGNNRNIMRRTKWVPDMWFIDHDYPAYPHNNDMIVNLYWVLDMRLFARSLDMKQSPVSPNDLSFDAEQPFTSNPSHYYTSQTREHFENQTSIDLNRVIWAIILGLDARRLYSPKTRSTLTNNLSRKEPAKAMPFLKAYPELLQQEHLMLHGEYERDENIELVCTAKLTAGPKRYDGAHERVCRHLRDEGYRLFGVPYPPVRDLGNTQYPLPPRRIMVLQRHLTRGIRNIDQVLKALRNEFEKFNVEVELVSTEVLSTAEMWVRTFSRAGVLISSHGSHLMGQIWMPMNSAIIEIMPVAFNCEGLKLLTRSCYIRYFAMQSMRDPKVSPEYYRRTCPKKAPIRLNKCAGTAYENPIVNVQELVKVAREALIQMGHELGDWADEIPVAETDRTLWRLRL